MIKQLNSFLKLYKNTLLSVLFFSLSFPPFNFFVLAYISLVPLICDIYFSTDTSTSIRFKKGLLFGFLSMAIFHSWFFQLEAFAPLWGVILLWLSLSLYLSLFYGLSLRLFKTFTSPVYTALWAASIWVLFEWIRSLGPIGNTAGLLGYSQTYCLPIIHLSSYGGIYSISFLCILINFIVFYALFFNKLVHKNKLEISSISKIKKQLFIFTLLILSVIFIFTSFQLKSHTGQDHKVAIIQPNHIQKRKLDSFQHPSLLQENITLVKQALESSPNTIILPETITSSLNTKRNWFISSLKQRLENKETTIIFGTPIKENQRYFNSAVSITKHGLDKNRYDKIKLMPFGEYWPFRPLLYKLGLEHMIGNSDYSSGSKIHNLPIHNSKFGIEICLESIYPWFARKQVQQGATVLITLVNNAWFFDSKAAEQHLQMSMVRAVENKRFLLQAANTGISAIISPTGKIIKQSNLDEQNILIDMIKLHKTITPYTKYGDIIILFSSLIIITGILKSIRNN